MNILEKPTKNGDKRYIIRFWIIAIFIALISTFDQFIFHSAANLFLIFYGLAVMGFFVILPFIKNNAEREKVLSEETEQLSTHSIYDILTNTLNRRVGIIMLENEVQQVRRNLMNVSIIAVEVDGYLKIMDRIGQVLTDKTMKKIAQVLQNRIRTGDYVFKLSTEEFLIVLSGCEHTEAIEVVGRIKSDIQKMNEQNTVRSSITLNFGISEYSIDKPLDSNDFINKAIRSLREEKSASPL